jgi:hypothetical protein
VLGIGGLAALCVGAWHLWKEAGTWQDCILAIIGTALVWLAIAQIRNLRRCG